MKNSEKIILFYLLISALKKREPKASKQTKSKVSLEQLVASLKQKKENEDSRVLPTSSDIQNQSEPNAGNDTPPSTIRLGFIKILIQTINFHRN